MKVFQACPFCCSKQLSLAFEYTQPPLGENLFPSLTDHYQRRFFTCQGCGHYLAQHDYDLAQLYEGDYNQSLYKGDKLKMTFERILALPQAQSDNQGRVAYINQFCQDRNDIQARKLLDIGSGTGVFPYLMAQHGWDCTASDPDAQVVAHLSQHAGLKALCGDFFKLEAQPGFELLSFNKVLEHVENPVAMLACARDWLKPAGLVYIELPDGEAAGAEGSDREEFFIEHYHAFSAASFCLLLRQAGFQLLSLERLREPSQKYTLRGFAQLLAV